MERGAGKMSRRIMPIENHKTASWANIGRTKEISRAAMPEEFQTMDAKDYVDENEK
jgi:hypothetical protein